MFSNWPILFEEVEYTADMVVGMGQKAGEDFHHARIELLLFRRAVVPRFDVGIVARKLGIGGNDAQLLLPRKDLFAVCFPTVVKCTGIFVGPFFGHVVRRVHGAGAVIHEERFVGRNLLGVGDEADGPVGQILVEMISFFRGLRRFNAVIVVGQIGVILVRVAAEETIESFKTAAEGPAVIGAGGRYLIGGGQVPLANGKGIVAMLQEHLRKEAVFVWDVAIVTGKTG